MKPTVILRFLSVCFAVFSLSTVSMAIDKEPAKEIKPASDAKSKQEVDAAILFSMDKQKEYAQKPNLEIFCPKVSEPIKRTDKETIKQTCTARNSTGQWTVRHGMFVEAKHKAKSPILKGAFYNNQKAGTWVYYHPNGKKWIEGQYLQGNMISTWTEWDDKGKLVFSAPAEKFSAYQRRKLPNGGKMVFWF